MKLVKIEAHGFKSFADPITLRFDGGVSGIIGPNGSGKSNINDAIKWVLGEQSSRELRGDNMDDVIFAGSKIIPAMDKAYVTLTFDNREHLSKFEEDYISITRKITRNKGSEYFINGEPSRQKDIKMIAMETGIGKSSLAIISQGTVAEIAEATDEQRRGIFEEAAGVSKYKLKKAETERKLEKTSQSLSQVKTIINELERQINPLQKQAEKAQLFLEKTEQLKNVEIALLGRDITVGTEKLNVLTEKLRGVDETKADYRKRIDEYNKKCSKLSIDISDLRRSINEKNGKITALRESYNALSIAVEKEKQRKELIASGQLRSNNSERLSALKDLIETSKHQLKTYEEQLSELIAKRDEFEKLNETLREEKRRIELDKNEKNKKKIEIETNIRILKQQKETHSNLFKGTKTILDNQRLFKGYKGLVADLIEVNSEFHTAIDTVLNNATQYVVVRDSETAVEAVNFLKKNRGGRATFIPMSSIQAKSVRDDHLLAIQGYPGFIGIASDLVKYAPEFKLLAKFLLGNIIVVEDVESANKISEIIDKKYMIVTKDGDTIRVGGVVVGGEKINNTNSLLGIDEQILKLENLLPQINEYLDAKENLSYDISNKIEQLFRNKNEIDKRLVSISEAKKNIGRQNIEYSNELKNLTTEEIKFNDHVSDVNVVDIEVVKYKLDEIESSLKVDYALLERYESDFSRYTSEKSELESLLTDLIQDYSDDSTKFELTKRSLENDKFRLTNYYNLTHEYVLANYVLEIDPEKAREFVDKTREEIEKIGNVNIESIEQLNIIQERYDLIKKNNDELEEAKETIIATIAEMDKLIITRLLNIVHDVNKEFDEIFRTMFGGGSAKIYFTDKNDILNSGIGIEAQPPGKNIKNLKLFSGGEKSLIAISLLFGILKARPLPLCILDEVDGALDEANVVRFAEYLQSLKNKTQFLVITHRHGSMSRMDNLFGATMQKRGVTTFFSVELAQAKTMVDDVKVEQQ